MLYRTVAIITPRSLWWISCAKSHGARVKGIFNASYAWTECKHVVGPKFGSTPRLAAMRVSDIDLNPTEEMESMR